MRLTNKPSTGPVTSSFGPRPPLSYHHGIDYGWYTAKPDFRIFAAASGRVSRVWHTATMGYIIEIDHGGGFKTRYNHLANAGRVSVGQQVSGGTYIGTMGSTGSEAVIGGIRQTHLHFELWRNGIRVDPAPYFSGSAGGGGKPIRRKKEDMPAVIKRTEGAEEWSLIWPSLRGPDDKQRGYIVTTDETRARWWTRFYEAGFDSSDKFGRDEYVQAQEYARLDHEAWLAGQAVLSVVDPGSVEGATKQDVDAAADRVIEKIPTAEQNGSASRTAIVRPT